MKENATETMCPMAEENAQSTEERTDILAEAARVQTHRTKRVQRWVPARGERREAGERYENRLRFVRHDGDESVRETINGKGDPREISVEVELAPNIVRVGTGSRGTGGLRL